MYLSSVHWTKIRPHTWLMDAIALCAWRHTIETINCRLENLWSARPPRVPMPCLNGKRHETRSFPASIRT